MIPENMRLVTETGNYNNVKVYVKKGWLGCDIEHNGSKAINGYIKDNVFYYETDKVLWQCSASVLFETGTMSVFSIVPFITIF